MANATLQLTGSVGGLPTGSKSITVPNITTSTAVGQITDLSLSTGDNVIAIPTGSTAAVILLPVSNTQLVTLKGVGGDTGIKLKGTTWSVISFDATQTSFILNAAASVAGVEISFI